MEEEYRVLSDLETEHINGQWTCTERLMDWLNTLEDKMISKSDVYKWAMEYRPVI
jgi:hypothetical protein